MKFLVVAPSWIGDAVAAEPLLRRLSKRHPGARIDVLASPWVAPVLRCMPQVDRVIDSPFRHGEFGLCARRRLGRTLAAERYDEAIVLPNSWKSALVPYFARIPRRTAFRGEMRVGLVNRRHALDKKALPQIAERYAQLAEPPGAPLERPLPNPRLVVDAARVEGTLRGLGLAQDRDPIALCPGAEYGPAKRWPAEHFAALARELSARGHAIWLIGSAKDAEIGAAIAQAEGTRNLCGRTSLDQAIDLLAGARFVVTNDSGLMHVAAALDRPQVAIFGSSSPRFTPPLSTRARILWLALDCSPCFRRECPLGHLRCLKEIAPQRVLEAMKEDAAH